MRPLGSPARYQTGSGLLPLLGWESIAAFRSSRVSSVTHAPCASIDGRRQVRDPVEAPHGAAPASAATMPTVAPASGATPSLRTLPCFRAVWLWSATSSPWRLTLRGREALATLWLIRNFAADANSPESAVIAGNHPRQGSGSPDAQGTPNGAPPDVKPAMYSKSSSQSSP